jgi:hypothetical protein
VASFSPTTPDAALALKEASWPPWWLVVSLVAFGWTALRLIF